MPFDPIPWEEPVEVQRRIGKTEEVLIRARDLIHAIGWAQWSGARKANGEPCEIHDRDIAALCALGGIARAYGVGLSGVMRSKAVMALASVVEGPESSIADWNDYRGRTRIEIYTGFNQAIRYAREHDL